MENSYTCTMINTGKELVMFDTGNGSGKQSTGSGFILKALAEAGYTPDQVDVVVTTHCHPDHFLGPSETGKPTYRDAPYGLRPAAATSASVTARQFRSRTWAGL